MAVLAVVVMIVAVLQSGRPASACSMAAPSGAFFGTLIGKHEGVATFNGVTPVITPDDDDSGPQPPLAARTVVIYEGGDIKFLRTHERYFVAYYRDGGSLFAGIHTAGECGIGGTTHADGRAIDTEISRVSIAKWIILFGLAMTVVVLAIRHLTMARSQPSAA